MEQEQLVKYIVPVFITVYGTSESDAIQYVERALDNTSLVFEDGIYSIEILEDDVELE